MSKKITDTIQNVIVETKQIFNITLDGKQGYALYYDENDGEIILSNPQGDEIYIKREAAEAIGNCLLKMAGVDNV